MTFLLILDKITVRSVNKIYRSCFRAINKKSIESSVKNNEVPDYDMPIQLTQNPYIKEKHKCILCKLNIEPDYKNVRLLSQFQSRYTGRIYEKHITGLCEHKQQRVKEEIRKAQTAGLMGFMTKDPEFVKDPKLFDPNHPFKSHKY